MIWEKTLRVCRFSRESPEPRKTVLLSASSETTHDSRATVVKHVIGGTGGMESLSQDRAGRTRKATTQKQYG